MGFTCSYSKENFDYVIELSPSEYEEIMEARQAIQDAKKHVSDLLEMYEKLCPTRVYATPKCINLADVLNK